jgi:hypothetical protein
VLLGVAKAAEAVVIVGLEVGAGGVEQQHVDLEVEQVGDGEEHLPLDRLVGLQQKVHRPVEHLRVLSELTDPGQRDVGGGPRQRRELGAGGKCPVTDQAEQNPLDPGVELAATGGSADRVSDPESLPQRVQDLGATERSGA